MEVEEFNVSGLSLAELKQLRRDLETSLNLVEDATSPMYSISLMNIMAIEIELDKRHRFPSPE